MYKPDRLHIFDINKYTGNWFNIGYNISNPFIDKNDNNIRAVYEIINNREMRILNISTINIAKGILYLQEKKSRRDVLIKNGQIFINYVLTFKIRFDDVPNILYDYTILYYGYHNNDNNFNKYDYAIITDKQNNIYILYRKKSYDFSLLNKIKFILKMYNYDLNNINFN